MRGTGKGIVLSPVYAHEQGLDGRGRAARDHEEREKGGIGGREEGRERERGGGGRGWGR